MSIFEEQSGRKALLSAAAISHRTDGKTCLHEVECMIIDRTTGFFSSSALSISVRFGRSVEM